MSSSDPYSSEYSATHAEEAASAVVDLHLPEERLRIGDGSYLAELIGSVEIVDQGV